MEPPQNPDQFNQKSLDRRVHFAVLLAHCREHLGGFEVPKLICFVDELLATSTGKVRKNLLRGQFAETAEQAFADGR